MRGIVVPAHARCKERVENGGVRGVKLFAPARNHHVRAAGGNGFVGGSDSLGARRAGRGGRADPALAAEENADVDGSRVRHHAHVRGGRDAAAARGQDEMREFGDGGGLPDGRPEGDARPGRSDDGVVEEPRINERIAGGFDGHQGDAAHRARALSREDCRIELKRSGRRSNARIEVLKLFPFRHVADAAFVGPEGRAHLFPGRADRGDGGHAGDDHAAGSTGELHQKMPPETGMTARVM